MRAIAIDKYGTLDEMKLKQLAMPIIGPKDICIEVHASAVNPVDIAIRNGWLHNRTQHTFPLILGWDVSGVVSAIGSEVEHVKVGDEVYSYVDLPRNGTYAEYVAVDEKLVALKPKNIDFLEAASLPLVGTCSYRALIEDGKIKKDDRVLILGGAGGVGSFAIQLAKNVGAYVVTTTSSKNIDFVKSLGADEIIDYTTSEPGSYPNDFDFVFDTVGREAFEHSFNLVKPNGKIVSIATFVSSSDLEKAKAKDISVQFLISDPDGGMLREITCLVEQDKIKPVIGAVFPLEEAQKAHQLSETKHARGKIILQVK